MWSQLKEQRKGLVIAGDGRHDSMGHSAKYGAYTVFNCDINMILDFALLQRNEVGSSQAMEYAGFQKAMKHHLNSGFEISALVSDCHLSTVIQQVEEIPKNEDILRHSGTSDGTLDVRVMLLRSGVLKAMGSTGDKDEETGAGVGGDESSQEIDSYGIDRTEDSLKNQLEVLIEDPELIMVAMKDFIIELKDISEIDDGIDEQIESRIMESKLIVEPLLMDIKSVSKDIQGIMKKLNFKSDLVREYTTSRSYDAKIDLMKKIPRDVELSIRRTMSVDHEWTMSEFLNKLREERLFRGMDEATPRVQNSREERNHNKGKSFAISPNATCAFCLGEHSSADCSVVTEKGHRLKDCCNKKPCSKCNEGEHHPVICEKEESVPNMHVVTPGGIAYQTVLAKVNVKGKPSITCRCLLDTGCDKTYMLQKTANLLKSKPLRQERKVLDTVHGEKQHIYSVYKIEVKDMKEKLKFETEVSTLSKLTPVKNVKPQILKKKFKHLKNLEFSDISNDRELEIDVIIGLGDLCKLKTGNMKWGNAGDPVAEETTLGRAPHSKSYDSWSSTSNDGDVKHDNDADFDDKNVNKRMQFLRAKLEHVWNRWSKEYLLGLREYHCTTKGGEALPELGTLVLIIDTTIERRFWKLAKISSYIKGRDHVVRAVRLDAVSQGRKIVMERPLQGICPLEIKAQVEEQHTQEEQVQAKEVKPRRVAAFVAEELLKVQAQLLNQE
eukprot:Seg1216.2 transcript_id=Seg1216.2/GoldUCD/mRNA.D3Y31 product="hypothetical protein" protein_id=Seg1216.2/GoldUCD/D3Y31